MTTVAILPTRDASGEKSYRAMSDDKPFAFGDDARRLATASLTQSTENAKTATPSPLCVYAGDKHSIGKTAGQALDALTAQLGETEFSALLVISAREQCELYRTNSIVQW